MPSHNGTIALAAIASAILPSCVASSGYDRAKQLGLNYSDDAVLLTLTGRRLLGEDEDFIRYGRIRPVELKTTLGQSFALERKGIVHLSGTLVRVGKDTLHLAGHYVGKDALGRPIDVKLDTDITMAIHGGCCYLTDPRRPRGNVPLHNDFLTIAKIRTE